MVTRYLILLLALVSVVNLRIIDLDNYYNEGTLHDELYNYTMEWGTYKPN